MKPVFLQMGECSIDASALICDGAIIGKSFRRLLDGYQEPPGGTIIGAEVFVGHYAIVGAGSKIGKRTIIDDRSTIESRVMAAEGNLFIYSAHVCNDVIIGGGCVIGGLIGERAKIGNGCRVFGKIVHSQYNPLMGWDDDEDEESPILEDNVFVGMGAVVCGGVVLGRKSYIAAGAVITKNVLPKHVAFGLNKTVHHSKLISKLGNSAFFKD